jgi:hypothetical protein
MAVSQNESKSMITQSFFKYCRLSAVFSMIFELGLAFCFSQVFGGHVSPSQKRPMRDVGLET